MSSNSHLVYKMIQNQARQARIDSIQINTQKDIETALEIANKAEKFNIFTHSEKKIKEMGKQQLKGFCQELRRIIWTRLDSIKNRKIIFMFDKHGELLVQVERKNPINKIEIAKNVKIPSGLLERLINISNKYKIIQIQTINLSDINNIDIKIIVETKNQNYSNDQIADLIPDESEKKDFLEVIENIVLKI